MYVLLDLWWEKEPKSIIKLRERRGKENTALPSKVSAFQESKSPRKEK